MDPRKPGTGRVSLARPSAREQETRPVPGFWEPAAPRQRERAGHVRVPGAGRQLDLRPRRAPPPERVPHGQAEFAREQFGLVEAARGAAAPVQRHGHGNVRTGEHVGSVRAQQRAQARGQRAPPLVLEGMDDVPEVPLVRADRAGARNGTRRSPAGQAARRRCQATGRQPRCGGGVGPAPKWRERIAAGIAEGRRERPDALPAPLAHRAGGRRLEDLRARRAGGRDDDGGQRVDQRGARSRRPRVPCARRCPRAARGRRSGAALARRRAPRR